MSLRYFTATLKVSTRWLLGCFINIVMLIYFIPLKPMGVALTEMALPPWISEAKIL